MEGLIELFCWCGEREFTSSFHWWNQWSYVGRAASTKPTPPFHPLRSSIHAAPLNEMLACRAAGLLGGPFNQTILFPLHSISRIKIPVRKISIQPFFMIVFIQLMEIFRLFLWITRDLIWPWQILCLYNKTFICIIHESHIRLCPSKVRNQIKLDL